MKDPKELIDYLRGIPAFLRKQKELTGVTVEARIEGQGVEIVKPGIIVMLSAPQSAYGRVGALQWPVTIFALPDHKAEWMDEVTEGLRLLKHVTDILQFSDYRALQLDPQQPVTFVQSIPGNSVYAVQLLTPFTLAV